MITRNLQISTWKYVQEYLQASWPSVSEHWWSFGHGLTASYMVHALAELTFTVKNWIIIQYELNLSIKIHSEKLYGQFFYSVCFPNVLFVFENKTVLRLTCFTKLFCLRIFQFQGCYLLLFIFIYNFDWSTVQSLHSTCDVRFLLVQLSIPCHQFMFNNKTSNSIVRTNRHVITNLS